MKELIEVLPQIIIYIVIGFSFAKTFHFVALKQNNYGIEHILTLSLVLGYIIWNILHLIPISISFTIDTLGMTVTAVILGYVTGMLLRSKQFIGVLDLLKIHDTPHVYYWDSIMDNDFPMKVIIGYEECTYEGMIHNYESYSNSPHMVLAAYVLKDGNGKLIEDNSDKDNVVIVLDTESAKYVKVVYYAESKECKDIQSLVESNKDLDA